jgi:hypothetical protein
MPTDRAIPRTDHFPPDLAELCDILARGIVRLRSRAAAENARAAGQKREVRLHSVPAQRRHANRTTRRDA